MKLSKAMSQKIAKICLEKNISLNELANRSCLTQSTIQSIALEKVNSPQLITIVRIADGLGIKLSEFFDDDLFENIEIDN